MGKHVSKNLPEHEFWTTSQLQDYLRPLKNVAYVSNYFSYMTKNINDRTSFLDVIYPEKYVSFAMRCRFILLGIESLDQIPKCTVCGTHAKFDTRENSFGDTCFSKSCINAVKNSRIKEAHLTMFSDEEKKKEVVSKRKNTKVERYGKESPTVADLLKYQGESDNKPEHRTWTVQQIQEFLLGLKKYDTRVFTYYTNLLENIKEKTTWLDEIYTSENVTQQMRVASIKHGLFTKDHIPLCTVCNTRHASLLRRNGYTPSPYCLDEECIAKYQRQITDQTWEEIYPEGHPTRNKEVVKKFKTTNQNIYGVPYPAMNPDIHEKARKTCMERFGAPSPILDQHIREKIEKTNIQRYGHATSLKNKTIRSKILMTNREKYGVDNPMSNVGVQKKVESTNMQRYGVSSAKQKNLGVGVLDKLNSSQFMQFEYEKKGGVRLAKELGVDNSTIYNYLKKHSIPINPLVGSSFAEREIAEYVESLGVEIIRNDRTILNGKELDIYIPSHNLAIEYNGIFWHSTKFIPQRTHLDKTLACEAQGIRLIQIFEDEWNDRPEVIKRKIAMLLNKSDLPRVYARQCTVKEIDNDTAKPFYKTYHVQGHAAGGTVLSLVKDNEIVACMSFKVHFGYMELIRYASSAHVVGGFTKLLNHFMKCNPDVEYIISFADRRWSDGNVYTKNNFYLVDTTYPNYYYVIDDRRVKKQKFRHKYLAEILEGYDPNLSERENTEAHDIWRIYDCGMFKFRIDNPYHNV